MKKGDTKKKKKLPPGVRERDGRYTFRYTVYVYENGKRKRKQKETEAYPTAQAAYDAGILIRADQLKGKSVDSQKMTVREWRDRWIEDYKIEREASINTISNRVIGTNSFLKYVGDGAILRDITVDDYQRWLNHLKRKGKKKSTLSDYHSSVRIMFADAVRRKIITASPADDVILPAYKATLEEIEAGDYILPRYCEKDELKKLLNVIRFRNAQDYRIAVVLAYTGLRISELAALGGQDFLKDEKVISVTKTLTVKGRLNDFHIGPPKTKSSIRKVTIGKTVIKTIEGQLDWQKKKIDDGEKAHSEHNFIFRSDRYSNLPLSIVSFGRRFKKYVASAGLPKSITPHSLRHTHVSLLAEAGEQLSVIQERLGHKNDRTTELIYTHVTKGQKKLTPDRFERIMGG